MKTSQKKKKAGTKRKKLVLNFSPWQKVQLARHPKRPYTLDYTGLIMKDFIELHGDRHFADDKSIVGGMAKFEGHTVMVIGHQKGRDTHDNLMRNFGMPHPEGYRKALRLMKMAEKFNISILSFIDTPGAFPGIGAEERGQSEAIAMNLFEMSQIRVPIIVIIVGEGGSGGALGIGVGDRILMLENAIYSVISPEGCAAILWKDQSASQIAAQALKLTAQDLYKLEVIDEIICEPRGGAHENYEEIAHIVKKAIHRNLVQLRKMNIEDMLKQRYDKLRKIGQFREP